MKNKAIIACMSLGLCFGAFACPKVPDEPEKTGSIPQSGTGQDTSDLVDEASDEKVAGPLIIIGMDGLDLKLLERYSAEVGLPAFGRLMEHGVHGVLMSEREMRSPALWTTIATGRSRDDHGIFDFITGSRYWPKSRRSERRRLVTSRMRRVPALWELAGQAGIESLVVGWIATWPAQEIEGVMVAPYVALGKPKQVTIKGKVYKDARGQVQPAHLWPELKELVVSPDQVPKDLIAEFGPPPSKAQVRLHPQLEKYWYALRWSLANTLTTLNITLHQLKSGSPDLILVYFEGSDSLAHRFFLFTESVERIRSQLGQAGQSTQDAAELKRAYGHVLRQTYALLDRILDRLRESLPSNARLLIVSDHGFGPWTGEYPLRPSVPFTGQHRLEGCLIYAGPMAREGQVIRGASLYDIAPTALDLLGLEIPSEMEGRSLKNKLRRHTGHARPIPSLEAEEHEEEEAPFEGEEIERLRSLGYVE